MTVAFLSTVAVRADADFSGGGAVPQHRSWPDAPAGGAAGGAGVTTSPRPYPFFPLAANIWEDSFIHDFVDVAGPPVIGDGSIRDWDCSAHTYDGHTGQDAYIRTFDEQDIGVPAFAALDGIVVQSRSTEPDKHTGCEGLANFVLLDHGGGHRTRYLHFRQESVNVEPSQFVPAGTQIALTGSSGCSFWPHLHFESTLDRFVYEPSAGPCREGESNWVHQVPIERETYLWDFNVSDQDLSQHPSPPYGMPRAGMLLLGATRVSFWILIANLPESSTYRARYVAPDGSERFDTGEQPFGNPFYRVSWWWRQHGVDLDTVGTWRIQFDINGARHIDAPFEVVATAEEIVNRRPFALEGVRLEPAVPNERDAVFCRVTTQLLFDDPDYDVVRYHYRWEVNGQLVRDVTHAGQADAIPWTLTDISDTVRCAVVPVDATDEGPGGMAETEVVDSFHCPGDCDELGAVTVDEIVSLVDIALGNERVTRCLAGEIDGDGEIRVDEMISAVDAALSGCRPRPTPSPTPTALPQTPTPTPPPTFTRTPSSTPISCDFPLPQVEPVMSPTSNLIQTIRGTIRVTSERQVHSVCRNRSTCFSGTLRGVPPELMFAEGFVLQDGLNQFEVCTTVAPDCNRSTCTSVAVDGSPLEVVYVPPTFTPMPDATSTPGEEDVLP